MSQIQTQWENPQRVQSIQNALTTIPHNQTAVGIGFRLTHSPSNCLRCRAEISLLELSAIVRFYEDHPDGKIEDKNDA